MTRESVSVDFAAKLLGLAIPSVQGCLINSALPIGGAWKNKGSGCYKYHISTYLLGKYVGMKKSEVYDLFNEYKENRNIFIQEERVKVEAAAKILNMSNISVQGCIIHNALPIGGTWQNEGSTCYIYHISPYLLGRYIGMKKSEVHKLMDEYEKEKELNKAC